MWLSASSVVLEQWAVLSAACSISAYCSSYHKDWSFIIVDSFLLGLICAVGFQIKLEETDAIQQEEWRRLLCKHFCNRIWGLCRIFVRQKKSNSATNTYMLKKWPTTVVWLCPWEADLLCFLISEIFVAILASSVHCRRGDEADKQWSKNTQTNRILWASPLHIQALVFDPESWSLNLNINSPNTA